MLKKLFIAIALSVGLVAADGAANLTFVPEAQAFSLMGAAKKVGKGVKKGAKAVGREAKRVGNSIGRDLKRNSRAVGRAAKKVGRATEDYFDDNVSVREFGRSWGKVGKGAWRGAKKAGKAIGRGAKCAAKGGCAKIGPPPGRPRAVDHR